MSPSMTTVQMRERLDEIVRRRNQIVHEGDYRRLDRPQDNGRNVMSHKRARDDINFIRTLIDAIHAEV